MIVAMSEEPAPHKRRPRYSGNHPRKFTEKYKELNPEKYPETVRKVIESGKTPAGMHRPICVAEVLEALRPKPGEKAVDATLGYGGHASELLPLLLPGGLLVGVDTDPMQLPKTIERLRGLGFSEENFVAVHSNFAGLPAALGKLGIDGVDMVLADLGVSSMQIDDPERGFSFKTDGPLDLRMNPRKGFPASTLLPGASPASLAEMFRVNSDEPFADILAAAICEAQARKPITTTRQLAATVNQAVSRMPRQIREAEGDKPIRRIFQALRIETNDEFGVLDAFLRNLPQVLRPGGRAAILTFHSGEDRRVKKAFEAGAAAGLYSSIADDVVRPTSDEVRSNPRASSAKLRWADRAG